MTRTALAADPLDVGALAEFAAIVGTPLTAEQHEYIGRAAKRGPRHSVIADDPAEALDLAALLAAFWLFVERHPQTIIMGRSYPHAREVLTRVADLSFEVPELAASVVRVSRAASGEYVETAGNGATLRTVSAKSQHGLRGVSADRIVALDCWHPDIPIAVVSRTGAQAWEVVA